MKFYAQIPMGRGRKSERGILLLDCLVYLGLFTLIGGMAFGAFYTAWDNSRALRRSTQDIALAITTGERWREDVRNSIALPEVSRTETGVALKLREPGGVIFYILEQNQLWRTKDNMQKRELLLSNVSSSKMYPDTRTRVTAWEWELELQPARKQARTHPKFLFTAVTSTSVAP